MAWTPIILRKKEIPNISKNDFSSGADPSIFVWLASKLNTWLPKFSCTIKINNDYNTVMENNIIQLQWYIQIKKLSEFNFN